MSLLDLIFPKNCLGCGRRGVYLCQNCLNKVPFAKSICPVCELFSFYGKTHAKCESETSLNGLINLWVYRGVIRKSIIKFKYKFAYDIAKELGKVSEIELRKYKINGGPVIVPIPLHKSRNNWRGFNQSEKLSREISKINGWAVRVDLLTRTKSTTQQVSLSKYDRFLNLKNKFQVNKDIYSPISKTQKIILFDDVWTTGSTIKEACRVLKSAGYKNVWGLTVARS